MPHAPSERIHYGDDENQFFELWRPKEEKPALAVFIHGGFWRAKYDLHHADSFCAALAAKGVAVANLEYRRVGQPGGGWPGTFEDVVAGVQLASARIGRAPIVVGHSAGGHLALRLAGEPGALQAVVALAPVADLRLAYELNLSNGAVVEFLGGTPESTPDRYDEACASRYRPLVRTVIIHGSRDADVPIALSQAFVQARKNDPEPPSLIEMPDAGHMVLVDPQSPAGSMVIEVVRRMT